jgi:hypothetical protein
MGKGNQRSVTAPRWNFAQKASSGRRLGIASHRAGWPAYPPGKSRRGAEGHRRAVGPLTLGCTLATFGSPRALSDAGPLQEESKDFQRKLSDAGRATYNARVGAHDDLILAVAIALWFSTNMPTWSDEDLVF